MPSSRFTTENIAQLMSTLLVMPLSAHVDSAQLNEVLHYVDATVSDRLVAQRVRTRVARFGDQQSDTDASVESQVRLIVQSKLTDT